MKTPRSQQVSEISPGFYSHVGIGNGISNILSQFNNIPSELIVHIGVDGVKFQKKTDSPGFWFIVGRIVHENKSFLFVIGIWFGSGKPANSDEFLRPFLDDWNSLCSSFSYNEVPIQLCLGHICADTPGKEFILEIKYHSGYNSCPKCHRILVTNWDESENARSLAVDVG
jgi:hypothetical protein